MSSVPDTVHRSPVWIPSRGRRRREQAAEEFITLLRQASALLQAGRRPERIWSELAGLAVPCHVTRPEEATDCCLHHVLRAAEVAVQLGEMPFATARGPGQERYWRQLEGCLAVSHHAGIALDGLLERLADALEAAQDAEQAREAETAGPRSTARLLGLLPLAGLGMSALVGAPPTDLLTGPLGWLVVTAGGGLALVGHLWTRALIRASEDTA